MRSAEAYVIDSWMKWACIEGRHALKGVPTCQQLAATGRRLTLRHLGKKSVAIDAQRTCAVHSCANHGPDIQEYDGEFANLIPKWRFPFHGGARDLLIRWLGIVAALLEGVFQAAV